MGGPPSVPTKLSSRSSTCMLPPPVQPLRTLGLFGRRWFSSPTIPDDSYRGERFNWVRRLGVGPGPGPTSERTECSTPLAETLEQCLEFISRHTRQFEVIIGTTRDVLPEYPTTVLREAIINALAHRDYNLAGATVDITIWDDRIEIQSPGSLPAHITVENMRHEHFSRNPRIMRVLKTMRLVEEYGEGIDRMYREMEARLLEPPIFLDSGSSVKVTLLNRFLVDVDDQVWLSLLGSYQLTADERRMLVAARSEGFLTPRRLRQLLPGREVNNCYPEGWPRACSHESESEEDPGTSCRMKCSSEWEVRPWKRRIARDRCSWTRSTELEASQPLKGCNSWVKEWQ